jgi:hypothetical protein
MFDEEYNTCRPRLILKEYGRNLQKLAAYLKTIEDKEKRTQYAYLMVDLMKQINPAVKETLETNQKLWDDLYIMSDFDLDIDSPFPMPEREVLNRKPQRLTYRDSDLKYKHYGRNIDLLIEKAIQIEDPEEKEAAIIYIGKLMKSFYASWNRENVDDESILKNMRELSNNKLDYDLERVRQENLFDSTIIKEKRPQQRSNGKGKGRGGSQNRRRRN